MTAQRYALVIGLALFTLGLVLGAAIPLSVYGDIGTQSCGTPWAGHNPDDSASLVRYGARATDWAGLCTSARQSRGTIALVLLGAGAAIAGLYFVKRPAPASTDVDVA